jgi:hypothetical protein
MAKRGDWRLILLAFLPALGLAERLAIAPPSVALSGPGAAQRLIVSATNDAGDSWDATPGCRFSSSDESVARVETGRLVGVGPGSAEIRAECAEGAAIDTVRVGERPATAMEIDFSRDLLSILTTKGCNSTACHGSPAGQAGFKLSLYGANPAADHEAIVRGQDGRRVQLDEPEKSLILAKPSFAIAHGGGHLMTPESDEYRTILEWLRQGARFDSSGPSIERIEIFPSERILVGAGARQPLVVVGRLSDGSTRDMTDEVRFGVDDTAVVSEVALAGGAAGVTAMGRGATTVLARGMGRTATARMVVIEQRAGAGFRAPEAANFIDRHIFETLRRVNIEPYPVADDRTFVRRVYFDAIGLPPSPEEVEAFVADARPDKRARLIDDLLDRDAYSLHWLVKFEDWFRNSQYYSQGRTNGSYKRWLRELIAEDRPYDEAAREMLTATGDTTVRPAGNFWHPAIDFMLKEFQVAKAVPTITRVFLGVRVECAECHNHPLENLTQDDYFGMAAFLARTEVKHGYGQYRRVWYDKRAGEFEHPATKQPVEPAFLGGERAEIPDGATRREVLADWITREQRQQFARAAVNRVWYEYFGRGLVEPFDDFRSTNRASHPELLDELAAHFIDAGFRFKSLHRLILNSNAYQLAAHTPERPGGEDPLADQLFARYVPRKIPAEALLDAIVAVTGVGEKFSAYPEGTSAKELIASIGATYFLTTFGHPRRDVMEARDRAPSLSQALHLMNGESVGKKVAAEGNIVDRLLDEGLSDSEIVCELYLRAYARPPEPEEAASAAGYVSGETAAGRERRQAFGNLLWAILNSKEFQLTR